MRAAFVPTADREDCWAYFINGCKVLRVNYEGVIVSTLEYGDRFTPLSAVARMLEEDNYLFGVDFAIENSDDFDIEGI